MATAVRVSVNIVRLLAHRNCKVTFPIFAVGPVLTCLLSVILDITISGVHT